MGSLAVSWSVLSGCLSSRASRIAVAACAILVAHAARVDAQPTIQFKSRELQEGRNYIHRLSPLLAVGESTGQVTYAFPIDVAPGRGVTPSIALEYSSSGGPSEYGWGWELTIPTIERSDRAGAPSSAPGYLVYPFRYRTGHQVAELEAAGPWPGGWQEYRERSERTYNRYLFDGFKWRILTPSGLLYELGPPAPRSGGPIQAAASGPTRGWSTRSPTRTATTRGTATRSVRPAPRGSPRSSTPATT